MWSGAKVSKSCRSRQELSNKHLFAECIVDTAAIGPLKVCQRLTRNDWKIKKLEKRQGIHIRPGVVDHALHGARRDVQDADLAGGLIRKSNHVGILKITKINELLANFVRPVLGCVDVKFCKY